MNPLLWILSGAATVYGAYKYLKDKDISDAKQNDLEEKINAHAAEIARLKADKEKTEKLQETAREVIAANYKPEE